MADLLMKARDGRANALKTRAGRQMTTEMVTSPDGRPYFKSTRCKNTPIFVSSKTRATQTDVVSRAGSDQKPRSEISYSISIHTRRPANALLH